MNFSYNNRNNKFELSQYQNEIKNNLINKSSEEILLFLKLIMIVNLPDLSEKFK